MKMENGQPRPKLEKRVPHTPVVFEECENKRLGAYVTWKNIRNFVGRRLSRISRMGVPTPPATMQKRESKGVAGGASWKLLKTKVQICKGIEGQTSGLGL